MSTRSQAACRHRPSMEIAIPCRPGHSWGPSPSSTQALDQADHGFRSGPVFPSVLGSGLDILESVRETADSTDVPTDVDIEHIAAAFDPHSDRAWAWAFSNPDLRAAWMLVCAAGAVVARRWSEQFSPRDARTWIDGKFTITEAAAWGHSGLQPGTIDICRWRHADPAVVFDPWNTAGFGAAEAHAWQQHGATVDHAASLAASHLTPAQADTIRRTLGVSWDHIVYTAAELRDAGWNGWQIVVYVDGHRRLPSGTPMRLSFARTP